MMKREHGGLHTEVSSAVTLALAPATPGLFTCGPPVEARGSLAAVKVNSVDYQSCHGSLKGKLKT